MDIEDIKKLSSFKAVETPAISIFLNINAKRRRTSHIKTVLTTLLEEECRRIKINRKQKKFLKNDIEKIHSFINLKLSQGKNRSLVIYANSASNFFKVIYLTQPVEDKILISDNLLIKPLLNFFDNHQKYLAVLVDQSRGRFFEIKQGATQSYYYFREVVPNKVREGGYYGYDERHIEKHVEEHLHKHYQKVAAITFELLKKSSFRWLLLVGLVESTTHLKKDLHPYPKSKLIKEIRMNLIKYSVNKIMPIIFKEIEKKILVTHQNLLHELKEKYPKNAVLDLADVESELNKKRVAKLLLNADLNRVYLPCGHRLNINKNVPNKKLICPKCLKNLFNLDVKTNELTIKALNQNSEVYFIENKMLEKHDGVGAILRF